MFDLRVRSAVGALLGWGGGGLATLTAVAAVFASHPAPMQVKVDPLIYGMHDSSLDSLGRLSVKSLRLWDTGTAWNQIEVTPGVYDWSRLDPYVTAAQQAHVDLTYVAALTPAFYARSAAVGVDPATTAPSDIAHYAAFLRAAMVRYRNWNGLGRGIASYQVWNEGNISGYWTGGTAKLAALVKAAWTTRNAVDPGVTIVGPPLTMRLPYQQAWATHWAEQKVGGQPVWKYMDAAAFNLYPAAVIPGTSRPGTPEDSLALLLQAKTILAEAGWPASLPLWNTEVNYGLIGGPTHPLAASIPSARQAAYVIRTYALNAAQGVSRVDWYSYDLGSLANTLLSAPGDPTAVTRAGRAYNLVQTWLAGTMIGPDPTTRPCVADAKGTYTCLVRYAAGYGQIIWNPTRTAHVVTPTSTQYVQSQTGAKRTVTGGSSIKVDYRPVLVRSSKAR